MPERKQLTAAICLALAVGTLAVYFPALSDTFINYDDPDYIIGNTHVNGGVTWSGIVWALRNSYAANWHPLTWISHMMDCQLFGIHNPGGHHLVSVLFHTANTILLFLLLNMMTGAVWRSAFVAALFAWHPLHVESVAWASERKDVLSAFFWMLALICYAKYSANDRGKAPPSIGFSSLLAFCSSPCYWLALLLFACGLMSKPMVVTLPLVLLLLDFWPLQRFNLSMVPRLVIEKIPFFALMFASCAITLAVQQNARWSSASLPFSFRLANTLMSYVRYVSKIFLPKDLALIYPYPHSWPLTGVIAAAVVLALLSLIFLLQVKRFPYLAVGWFWFLGTLVPVIGLIQVGVQAMADRYTYLPSVGVFILVTWGVTDLLDSSYRKTSICVLAGGAALIMCLVLTSLQLSYWKNSLTIFLHTYEVTTDNYAAADCLGKTLHNLGKYNEANQFFEKAVSLEPDYPMAQFDLGMNLLNTADSADASNHIATAVRLWPANPTMQYDYGVLLWQHKNFKDSLTHINTALAINPDFPEAREWLKKIETNSAANRSTP
jgi:tetratricopeptide (TPR) repeat protein